jgi:hypothetical protein
MQDLVGESPVLEAHDIPTGVESPVDSVQHNGTVGVEKHALGTGTPEVVEHLYRPLIDHLEAECRRVLRAAETEAATVRSKAEDEARRIVTDAHRERSVLLSRATSKQAHMYEEAEAEIQHWLEELDGERHAVLEVAENEATRLLREAAEEAETRSRSRLQLAEIEAGRIIATARAGAAHFLQTAPSCREEEPNGEMPESPTTEVRPLASGTSAIPVPSHVDAPTLEGQVSETTALFSRIDASPGALTEVHESSSSIQGARNGSFTGLSDELIDATVRLPSIWNAEDDISAAGLCESPDVRSERDDPVIDAISGVAAGFDHAPSDPLGVADPLPAGAPVAATREASTAATTSLPRDGAGTPNEAVPDEDQMISRRDRRQRRRSGWYRRS